MSIQEIYYAVATPVILTSLGISIALFFRSKPDRIKAAIESSLEPIIKRLDEKDEADKVRDEKIEAQGVTLQRLEADLRHMPTHHDLQALHGRITDVLKEVSQQSGRQSVYNQQIDRIHQLLMRDKT